MSNNSKISLMKKRRGISNIIGSLIILAVVASVGSVILFQGLNQINAFTYQLTLHDKEHVNELREDVIFEHVRFEPISANLFLYLANIGSVDSTIATVTVVKIDTQELIIRENLFSNSTILIEDHIKLDLMPTLDVTPNDIWDSAKYRDSLYKITVTTSKGNFFSTYASPFNT